MRRQSPPVVFIHGFKGCHLRHRESNRNHWLTAPQALGLSNPGIALPLDWQGQKQKKDALEPAEPLRRVLHVPFYGPLMDWCGERGAAFYPFSYDWRRDNSETLEQFIEFLREVTARHEGQGAQVIAHSNGGLISYGALLREAELFHSVVFAATPFGGGLGMLEDLHLGTTTGFNKRSAGPDIMFSFVTAHQYFPESSAPSEAYTTDGQLIPLDWYDAESWEEHRFGPFARCGDLDQAQKVHLGSVLRRCREFRQQLKGSIAAYPPIAVMATESRPTLGAIQADTSEAHGWSFKRRPKEGGDGRVRFHSCLPPDTVPYELYRTKSAHSDILLDTRLLGRVLQDLEDRA